MNARIMSKSTHSNWKKKPLKKLTCLHFEPGPQTSGLVGSSAIFNGAKVFIATTLRAVGTGRGGPPRFWQEYQQHLFLPKVFCLIVLLVQKCFTTLKFFSSYTPGGFVWCDRPFYLVKLSQEKWECDFHDDALPLSFQLQVTEVHF